jgi:hypothetical protein
VSSLDLACRPEVVRPAFIAAGPIEGIEDAGTGTKRFGELCLFPLKIRLASDSPPLAVVATADFHPKFGVLVTDPIEKRVFQFDLRGRLLRTFGAPGGSPAEFRDLVDAVFVGGGNVVALDGLGGLALFDKAGRLIRAPLGGRLVGGKTLARLGSRKVMVGIGEGLSPREPSLDLVQVFDVASARALGSFAPESWDRLRSFVLFRGVRVAADPSGSVVAVGVPYRLDLDLFSPNGRPIGSWKGHSAAAYRVPQPHPAGFFSRSEADQWILSSSYLSAVSVPDSDQVLLAWDSYDGRRRHHHLAVSSRVDGGWVSLEEVPYRFLRGIADTLVFLNSAPAPHYEVIACRGWAPLSSSSQAMTADKRTNWSQ